MFNFHSLNTLLMTRFCTCAARRRRYLITSTHCNHDRNTLRLILFAKISCILLTMRNRCAEIRRTYAAHAEHIGFRYNFIFLATPQRMATLTLTMSDTDACVTCNGAMARSMLSRRRCVTLKDDICRTYDDQLSRHFVSCLRRMRCKLFEMSSRCRLNFMTCPDHPLNARVIHLFCIRDTHT